MQTYYLSTLPGLIHLNIYLNGTIAINQLLMIGFILLIMGDIFKLTTASFIEYGIKPMNSYGRELDKLDKSKGIT